MTLRKKILVVDDESALVSLVSLHMRMAGHDVFQAFDGEQALELARQGHPDLLILDIMLPKIDGWQVCHRLRSEGETKNIPVVLLSARSEKEDILKGFEAGADDYIAKPFSPKELVERVKRVLMRSESKQEIPVGERQAL